MNKILDFITDDMKYIAITGHVRPDGDCIGSTLAMYHYLKDNTDKEIRLFLEKAGANLLTLPGSDEIISEPTPDEYAQKPDLFIALDCADVDRMGFSKKIFEKAARTLCIDHHISNAGIANENIIIPQASSASEIVFEMFEEERITKEIAECLYLGIIHDTGVFHHSCTGRRTMEIAGVLMSKGIDFGKIIDDSFYKKTYLQNQLLGRCLTESISLLDGKIIAAYLTHADMEFYGVSPLDLGGVVDQLRLTEGVQVAVFFYETIVPDSYKVSLRSTGIVDVNKVAGVFGGGGHVMASGCLISGTPGEVLNKLSEQIALQL